MKLVSCGGVPGTTEGWTVKSSSRRRRAAYDNIIILTWGPRSATKLIMRLVHNFNWILTIPTEPGLYAFILSLSQTVLIIQVITIANENVSLIGPDDAL